MIDCQTDDAAYRHLKRWKLIFNALCYVAALWNGAVCCKVLRAYYVSLGAGLSLFIVFSSPQRISFYSSSHQSEHPICAFNISECPIRLADLRLIVLFSVPSFSAHHLLSYACLLINVQHFAVSFSTFIYPLILSFFSLIDDSCLPCFLCLDISLPFPLSVMDFSMSVGPLLLLKRLQKTCSVEMTGN